MITLPSGVSPSSVEPFYIDYGSWNEPSLGGEITRTDRPGNRHGLRIDLPPTKSDETGNLILSRIKRAKRDTMRFPWPMGDLPTLSVGSPVVNASTAQGTSLPLRGMTPALVIPEGRPFTLYHAGKAYLHETAADATVSGTGTVTLTIEPELRVIAIDADATEWAAPVIDGVCRGNEWAWTLDIAKFYGLSFELVERY